ncbi:MAG: DUF3955 domain-containing protein [Clostridiales bacterium]|nr:DUF3955 domain-containing protein [Candidatus Crickella merdequi]
MDFGSQIKKIREDNGMTQEQFALKLNVSRQAVSNWENNKNLPDIGMLIVISNVFLVSLDYLIKGDEKMNNMTQKIIKDGSETRRAKFNMVSSIIGGVLLLMGLVLLIVKGLSVEYIDANGMLHENFFLIPVSFLCLFCGLISFLVIGIKTIFCKVKNKRSM